MKKFRNVKLTYFKASGKYYTHGAFQAYEGLEDYQIYNMVRLWANNSKNSHPLPELSTNSWIGFILVEPEDGVPAIVNLCNESNN